jgi:AcrR family transcriptional regulator
MSSVNPQDRTKLTGGGDKPVLGRPRDPRVDQAILTSVLQLIGERGIRELRLDDVADRAGVGKATIYRRYRSKNELITAAVSALVNEIEVPNFGSTAADLLELMRGAVAVYSDPVAAGVMPDVVRSVRLDPALAQALRDGLVAGRRAALHQVLERGVARGDLDADLDFELALDVLGGALFYRLLITGAPLDDQLAAGVVELILRGFASKPRQIDT